MARTLRPVTEADGPTLLRWRNSPEVARFMFTDHQISPEEHAVWLLSALGREDGRYFVMTCDGVDVGFASVTGIDRRQGTCEWAIYIGEPAARGRGMGAFTTYTILGYAFDELGMRKVTCQVLASNPAALAMYERFGFVREGRLREQIVKEGAPVDVHVLGILEREWREVEEAHRLRLIDDGVLTA